MMDSSTLPIDVKGPVENCEYRPNDSDATSYVTLLTIHTQSKHIAIFVPSHAALATANIEKNNRPTVDHGISLDDWLYFEQHWHE